VTLSNTRKAAMLLTSLDPGAAAELLKGVRPDLLTEIASEMVHLETTPVAAATAKADEHLRDFYITLCKPRQAENAPQTFVKRVLETAVGKQRSEELFGQARRLLETRDPFRSIRDAPVEDIAQALTGEHPQVAAVVLLELAPQKSAILVPLLEAGVQQEAVYRMTCGESISPEARARIASIVRSRINALHQTGAGPVRPTPAGAPVSPAATAKLNAHLRRVALLLRCLSTELRDNLVKGITQHDADVATALQNMMVLWEDIPLVGERSLQAVLRNVDARQLALALLGSDEATTNKIRSNISERARAMIDEETQLMKKPKADDVEGARATLLGYLRQLNASGELQFEGK